MGGSDDHDGEAFSGWRVLAALTLANACGIGLLGAYGLFVEPIAAAFDASMASIGAGMAIFILTLTIVGPAAGPVADKGPVRWLMAAGVAVMLGGMLLLARGQSLAGLALGMAVASAGTAMYGPVPMNAVITHWFEERRGLALAIAALGPPVAGFVLPPLVAWGLTTWGWRGTLEAIGIVAFVLALPPILLWVVGDPSEVGQHPDGRAAPRVPSPATEEGPDGPTFATIVRERDFWLMALGFGFVFAAPVGTGLYIAPFMSEQGIELGRASFVLASMALFGGVGALLAGALADRFDPRHVLFTLLGAYVASLVAISLWPRFPVIAAASVGLGLGMGGAGPLPPLFIGRRFGADLVGRVMGWQAPIGLPLLLAAAPLAGLLRDSTGSYSAVFLGAAAGILVACGFLGWMRQAPPVA